MRYLPNLLLSLNPVAAPGRLLAVQLRIWAVLSILLAGHGTALAGQIVATGFELSGDAETTSFTAIVSDDVGYTATVLPEPYRVIIDLADVVFDVPPGAGRKPKGLVKSIRYGVIEDGKSRIVIDTQGPVLITKSTLSPRAGKKPARINIQLLSITEDVFDAAFALDRAKPKSAPDTTVASAPSEEAVSSEDGAAAASAEAQPGDPGDIVGSVTPAEAVAAKPVPVIKPTLKPTPDAAKPKAVAAKPVREDGKKVIVIDPGHGGIDPGALSPAKTLEKDVVLAFAKDLKERMDGDGRHHVVLTRDDDRFVTLKDRVAFARKQGADLFIAIHADTLRGQTVTGTTIYTLSEKASDAESEALAQRENHADAIAGIDLAGQSEDVAGILIDLAQRDSRNQASMFSRATLRRFKDVTKMTGKPIRSAGFTVLKAPDVPSILIELGFLSNPKDEERLKSAAWRKNLAKALASAIDSHFAPAVAGNP
jgi:N-acetylmuramoyl-L-alanine amidase